MGQEQICAAECKYEGNRKGRRATDTKKIFGITIAKALENTAKFAANVREGDFFGRYLKNHNVKITAHVDVEKRALVQKCTLAGCSRRDFGGVCMAEEPMRLPEELIRAVKKKAV